MNKYFRYLASFLFFLLPIKKNTVLFKSFDGLYNDNPKYISESLHKISPYIRIIWCKSYRSKDAFPDYVETVAPNSFRYINYLFRSEVIVDNYVGAREYFGKRNSSFFGSLIGKKLAKKKRGQLNISTWHGTPLKRIGGDTINSFISSEFRTSCDFLVSGSKYASECYKHAFYNKFRILQFGTPRNDVLLDTNIDINYVKNKLGLPIDKKIILYAPTFREKEDYSGVTQMRNIDIPILLRTLNQKFGGEWCFIFRAHQLVVEKIKKELESLTEKNLFIDGNMHDDMAEYLICTDILITDYSGSLFDFGLTYKPCFLFSPDIYEYVNNDRGVYLPFNSLPFPKSELFEDLINQIKMFDYCDYKNNLMTFNNKLGMTENGTSSQKTAFFIKQFIEQHNIRKIR